MPKVARVGDTTTGHPGTHPPLTIVTGAGLSSCEGSPISRVGDITTPAHKPEPQTIVSGISMVKVEGSPAATVGSGISCGITVATGAGMSSAGG